jgi:hypothetical protein
MENYIQRKLSSKIQSRQNLACNIAFLENYNYPTPALTLENSQHEQ